MCRAVGADLKLNTGENNHASTIRNYIEAANRRREEEGEEGFSLIELIIVVVILGILVAIAIPIFGSIQATARHNALRRRLPTARPRSPRRSPNRVASRHAENVTGAAAARRDRRHRSDDSWTRDRRDALRRRRVRVTRRRPQRRAQPAPVPSCERRDSLIVDEAAGAGPIPASWHDWVGDCHLGRGQVSDTSGRRFGVRARRSDHRVLPARDDRRDRLPAMYNGIANASRQSDTASATRQLNALIESARQQAAGGSCAGIMSAVAAHRYSQGAEIAASATPYDFGRSGRAVTPAPWATTNTLDNQCV